MFNIFSLCYSYLTDKSDNDSNIEIINNDPFLIDYTFSNFKCRLLFLYIKINYHLLLYKNKFLYNNM